MEVLINFYHDLPTAIRWAVDFLFTVVFLRGIVANELLTELKKYGAHIKQYWHSDRNQAIREHYLARASGEGHQAQNPADCSEGDCLLFRTESEAPAVLSQSTSR